VFAVAVSTVVFPLISRFAAQGDVGRMGEAYRKGMRLILLVNIPAAVGLSVLAEPIIRMIFEHGAFTASDTRAMIPVLAVFAVGLPVFSFVNLILRAFYAFKDTRTPVRAAVLSFFVNVALSLALMSTLSTVGLALAGNAAILAQAWYLQVRLAGRDPTFSLGRLGRDLVKILAASVLMGLAVAAGWWGWSRWAEPAFLQDAIGVGVLIALGLGVYAGAVWLLRVEGRAEVEALLAKLGARLGLKRGGAAE
jgi:putative peptidoglycan lipid II flippase